jgi:hypothetical protein
LGTRECCKIPNYKSQIKITFPARKVKVGFGIWILGFEIYLKFGACNLQFALIYSFCFFFDQTGRFSGSGWADPLT